MPQRISNDSDGSKNNTRKPRNQSASQIARNVKSFETWATYQGCEEVSYQDIPEHLQKDVDKVFNLTSQLPRAWLDQRSRAYKCAVAILPLDFITFLQSVGDASPELFSSKMSIDDGKEQLSDLQIVYSAWRRLHKMRESSRKWSEADYVANVYNVFRSPAAHDSDYRAQCSISLPQPLSRSPIATKSIPILNAKTISPDSSMFVPTRLLRHLSHDAGSPYKLLQCQSYMANNGSVGGESSFRYQSTPCAKLPDSSMFEFASTFWEDKKPMHHMLDDAYRQNRMATTSAVRQLHSLHVQAPIFGLVWAHGTVRAHVDWWTIRPRTDYLSIRSAAYPGPKPTGRRTSSIFHEWNLDEPSDIVKVYLLIRNLDHWTVGGFRDRIEKGITQLVKDVVEDGKKIVPWRRKGDLGRAIPTSEGRPSFSITPTNSPPKRRPRRRARRSDS